MAENATDHLSTLLQIPVQHKALLGHIRHWGNLKIATDKESIWVKDFTEMQLASAELKAIPFIHLYVVKENLLFPQGSLLPAKKMPTLLWTPIERALEITLPTLNHNFFELPRKTKLRLVQTEVEQTAMAMWVNINEADVYMQTAPAIRLQNMQWVKMEGEKALFVGQPLLPINGESYWIKSRFIFPVGWALEFSFLENEILSQLDPEGINLIFWMDETHYCLVPQHKFAKLSIASWRASTQM